MERRKSERVITNWKATARVPASPITVTVVDFSATGCRLRASSELIRPGRTILLTIEGWPEIAGQVRWHERGHCGVEFSEDSVELIKSTQRKPAKEARPVDQFGRSMPPLPVPARIKVL